MSRKREHPVRTKIEHWYPVVNHIAGSIARKLPKEVLFDDLKSAGFIGLVQAWSRFDKARAERFGAYAVTRIRGAIIDDLRHGDLLTQKARTETKRRKPEDEPIETAHYVELKEAMNVAASDRSPEEEADFRQRMAVLADGMLQLSERTREVLRLRFVEELSQSEIGRRLKVTDSRVSQIEKAGLKHLLNYFQSVGD